MVSHKFGTIAYQLFYFFTLLTTVWNILHLRHGCIMHQQMPSCCKELDIQRYTSEKLKPKLLHDSGILWYLYDPETIWSLLNRKVMKMLDYNFICLLNLYPRMWYILVPRWLWGYNNLPLDCHRLHGEHQSGWSWPWLAIWHLHHSCAYLQQNKEQK